MSVYSAPVPIETKMSPILTRMAPTELWLLQLTDETIRYLRPVTSLDINDGLTSNFHDEGLYSTTIFGKVGTEERDKNFSYIDIKTPILHPKIFDDLCRLKGLYKGILSGKETAKFDPILKDFVADQSSAAETGYSFFMRHFKQIEFKRNKSPSRQLRVEFIEKYRDQATTTRVAVIPAGLRDLEIGEDGRAVKNEVHDLYYRLLSIANTIPRNRDMESPALDIPRWSLTLTFYQIFELFKSMLEGKKGFLLNKWGSRKIVHGTRNVISVMDTSSTTLGATNAPSYDSTVVGLFQTIKGLTPVTMYLLRTQYLSNIFSQGESSVPLVDKETLQPEFVEISSETRDRWTTKEGLLDVINSFYDPEARHRPVEVEGRWLALIYKGPDKTFRIFFDIRELPEHLDRKDVYPITLCEILYLSGYNKWNKYFMSSTRYPVASNDSIYPSRVYVKTTTVAEVRKELGPDWLPIGDEYVAVEFPRSDIESFYSTQAPHGSRLAGLVADFDGDTASGTYLMTDDALAENDRYLKTRRAWVSPDGALRASANYDTVKLVVRNLTRR